MNRYPNMKIAPIALGRLILFLLVVLLVENMYRVSGAMGADSDHDPPDSAHLIRMASIFDAMPGVNTEEARIALEMLMRDIMNAQGDRLRIHLEFITEFNQVARKIISERYDLVVLSGLDYLQIRSEAPLTPKLVLSKVDRATEPLALVTQRNETLASLRQKNPRALIIDAGRAGEGDKLWLDTVLIEAGLGPSDQFFTEIRRSQKPSRSVLPVFFGQVAACVVSESALRVMNELNPQIDQRVQILKRSGDLVTLLLCATPWADQQDIRMVVAEGVKAASNPKSKQALTMVHMNGFFRFEPQDLAASEALYKRYRRAMEKWGR